MSAGDDWALQPVMATVDLCMLALRSIAAHAKNAGIGMGWSAPMTQTCSSMFSSPCQDKISSARRPTNRASSLVVALLSMAAAMLENARQKWWRSGLDALNVGTAASRCSR